MVYQLKELRLYSTEAQEENEDFFVGLPRRYLDPLTKFKADYWLSEQ